AGERAGAARVVGGRASAGAARVEGPRAVPGRAGRVRGRRAHDRRAGRGDGGGSADGHADGGRLRALAGRGPRAAVASGVTTRLYRTRVRCTPLLVPPSRVHAMVRYKPRWVPIPDRGPGYAGWPEFCSRSGTRGGGRTRRR